MSNVYLRLLEETKGSNIIIDNKKYIWCPMSVGDFANKCSMGLDGRNIHKIIQYVYSEGRLSNKNFSFDVITWAEILLGFWDNSWLLHKLEGYVTEKYEKYLQVWPNDSIEGLSFPEIKPFSEGMTSEEFEALTIYHKDHNINKLIISLIGCGVLKTQPDWDSNFIYFRSVRTTELSLDDKKSYVVKEPECKWFLWMDVGAWSSKSAIVGIITPHEVAMYDIYGSKKDIDNCILPKEGTLATDILKSLEADLDGGAIFYEDLKKIKSIKTPLTKGEIIFIIPDLHIHLFKGFSADNFKQSGTENSLDEILAKVLKVIDKYQLKENSYQYRIIQVGDLYELWESFILLCIGLNPNMDSVKKTYELANAVYLYLLGEYPNLARGIGEPDFDEMKSYIKTIEAEAKRRNLHNIFKYELDLLQEPWAEIKDDEIKMNAKLKEFWKKMQKQIEIIHQEIFRSDSLGTFDVIGDQTIIAGNHDCFLDQCYNYSEDVIHFEHLHYNDMYNKPSNMKSGQFLTILNVIAETKGFGDQLKAMETTRRPKFLESVATINFEKYKNDRPMYELIVTGHTHRAYAQVIRMKLNKIKSTFEIVEGGVKYDQGWQKDGSIEQSVEMLKLVRANRNAILGGMGAMGWVGFGDAVWYLLFGGIYTSSQPFPDGSKLETEKYSENPPADIRVDDPNFLLCLILTYIGIPPSFFEEAIELLLQAKWAELTKAYDEAKAKDEFRSFREEIRAYGAVKVVKTVLTFVVTGKIGMLTIKTAAAKALQTKLKNFLLKKGATLAMLVTAEQAAHKIHTAIEVIYASGCIIYCTSIEIAKKTIEFIEATNKAIATTFNIAEGFSQNLTDFFIARPLIVMRMTMDHSNWDWDHSTIPPKDQKDFKALGWFLWSKLKDDKPNQFITDISRPLNTYKIEPELIKNISKIMTTAISKNKLIEFPPDVILQMTPLTFVQYLKDWKLLDYKKDPERAADEALTQEVR